MQLDLLFHHLLYTFLRDCRSTRSLRRLVSPVSSSHLLLTVVIVDKNHYRLLFPVFPLLLVFLLLVFLLGLLHVFFA